MCADPGDEPAAAWETTFQSPTSLALGGEWTLWVGDGARVRAVDLADRGRAVSTVLGGGEAVSGPAWCDWTPAGGVGFSGPVEDVAAGTDGALYVAAGGRLEEARFLDGAWAMRTRAGLDTGCASGVDAYEAHGVTVWQDWEVFVLDRSFDQERVMRLSPAFGGWWPVLERYEMHGLDAVAGLAVTRDGNLVVLASGSGGETGLVEVTRPQDAMIGLRLAPNLAGPGPMTWDLRHGEMGAGLERFDAEGRLVWSDLPGTGGPVHYEYGDGTDGVPAGALKRVIFSDPYSLTRYTDFLYDSRGKLAALRDEDGYETRVRIDDHGDLVLVQSAAGDFRIFLYDADHRLRAVIGEEGFADVIDYNDAGMVSQVSGMRGFLKGAPDTTWWLLDRLSPDTGLPWSPLTGFVTPVLMGLSDYLEDLCASASDCDDGLPLPLDWCEAGFCRHEMLGTFSVPEAFLPRRPCDSSERCGLLQSVIQCGPDQLDVCDDNNAVTWDVCAAGMCWNLPCRDEVCGCFRDLDGWDCRESALSNEYHPSELESCRVKCASGGGTDCHERCVFVLSNRVLGGCAHVTCEMPPCNDPHLWLLGCATPDSWIRGVCEARSAWDCCHSNDDCHIRSSLTGRAGSRRGRRASS